MIRLSEDQKHIFENNVQHITSKDAQRVLDNIDQELDKLTEMVSKQTSNKTEELINNSKLLLDILRCEDFPLTQSSHKWIVFGLNYLISDFDLIPDSIPRIGYLDDALVISWVKHLIDVDITRFGIYQKAKASSQKSSIMKRMIQGDGRSEVLLLPGFLSNEIYSRNFTTWVQIIQQSKLGKESPGISVLDWKTNYTPEFQNTILMVDHDLNLKPVYDSDTFTVDWQQLKTDYTNLSAAFFADLAKLKKQNPERKIVLIALNIGTFIVDNPALKDQLELIDDYYIFGGCSNPEYVLNTIGKKVKNIYNFFNYQDAAMNFIFDNFENMEKPIGLTSIYAPKNNKIKNVSLGNQQRRHTEYKANLTKLIDSV